MLIGFVIGLVVGIVLTFAVVKSLLAYAETGWWFDW